jgi:putative acetyltransferase
MALWRHHRCLAPARMDIRLDDLRHPAVVALLQEHLDWMHRTSPPESVHALDLDALRHDDISFWAVWDGDALAGCGALRELDPGHGEVKSMRTAQTHLRRGVAAAMLDHLLAEAKRRGYARLSLETGSMAYFAPAHALYARAGFVRCAPFGDYIEDPNSVFMTRAL